MSENKLADYGGAGSELTPEEKEQKAVEALDQSALDTQADGLAPATQGNKPEDATLSERERIALQREQDLLAEVGEAQGDIDAEDQAAAGKGAEGPAEKPPEKPEAPETMVKIKVDGVEKEVPMSYVLAQAQKNESADNRLKAAEQVRQEALADAERIRRAAEDERFNMLKDMVQPKGPEPQGPSLEELKAQRKEALDVGDYDLFEKLDDQIADLRFPKQDTLDPDKLVEQATNNAIKNMQYETAHSAFLEKNIVIANDPVLYNVSMATFKNMCAESRTYSEAFDKTEAAMKDWINSIAASDKAKGDDVAMAQRLAKKGAIPDEPGRVNAKLDLPPVQKEETVSDIVNEMRKARGQPV